MNELPRLPDAASEATHRLLRDALTASGIDPNALPQAGLSELHLLPKVLLRLQPPSGLIPRLVAEGADIEATDRAGRTPLHFAAQYGRNADLVIALLAAGADPGPRDEDHQTPLHRAAAFSDDADVLKALLEAGAAHHARDTRNRTPLHLAAREGRFAGVTALLAAGADIEARDEDGATPFHLAIARNDAAEVVAALESAGASKNDRDEWGRTPRDYCRSEQTYTAGALGVRPGEEEVGHFLTFSLMRWMTRIWGKIRRLTSSVVVATVVALSIFLLILWPVSWLAYWLIEDRLWRHYVTGTVPGLVMLWICWRGHRWLTKEG